MPYFFSGAQVAVAADPAGSLYVAYINEVTRGLHIGHLDAAAQLTLDHTVPGAVTDSPVILHETSMVDLAWTAEGLAVLWQGRESEEAQWQRGAKLFANGVWRELPNAPPGVAAVDRQGRLWLDGADQGSVLPARWTGSEWLSVAGGPVAHAWHGTMVFDADDNPIVAAGQNDIAVLRHKDGQWRALQGSDRPGGVTNSPCNNSIDPQLAIEGDRLCMSWLEAAEKPFGLLLRCTQLLD